MKYFLLLLISVCAVLAQDSPPPPPNWQPVKRTKTYSVLLSPKAATVQVNAIMAKGVTTNYIVVKTCTVVQVASEITNTAAWQITPLIQSYRIESSTDLVHWEELFNSRELCYYIPVKLIVFYPIGEKQRWFRVSPL